MTAVFGLTAAIPRMSKTNPYQFTGRENDATGLYYFRARYYSPTFQRFIAQDPIDFGGGINLYAYTLNNPITLRDLLGLCAGGPTPLPTPDPQPTPTPTPQLGSSRPGSLPFPLCEGDFLVMTIPAVFACGIYGVSCAGGVLPACALAASACGFEAAGVLGCVSQANGGRFPSLPEDIPPGDVSHPPALEP